MTDTVRDWIDLVDATYPMRDAEGWDAVGLHVGDPRDAVERILVTLDVTHAVLDEAADVGADLVIAHHPLLFRPLARLTPDTASGALALRAAREGVALLAAHTNLDVAVRGTTEPIVEALGLVETRPLRPASDTTESGEVKLVVFVPQEAVADVLAALSDAGAGIIGEYDRCSFRVAGTGTFRPSPAANPAVGERGEVNQVREDRLEVVVARTRLRAAVEAMVSAHPYEEVAYDVVPLIDVPAGAAGKGTGRLGRLPRATALGELADRLAVALPSPHLRLAGDPGREVSVVAACGGAGDGYMGDALAAGAELFVTGDLRHHVTLDAMTLGMALIDAGHYATEAPALPAAVERLSEAARQRGLSAGLLASGVRTEPWGDYRPPTAGPAAMDERNGNS